MGIIEILFWVSMGIIFYTYFGYGILLYALVFIKRLIWKPKNKEIKNDEKPQVTLFIAAYNEAAYIADKVKNCFEQDYPQDKLDVVFVTDGSDDGTPEKLKSFSGIKVYHENKRNGKIGAMNRGMEFIKTPIVIFTDANTTLNKEAVSNIVADFEDHKIGCVAGEKRIIKKSKDKASGSGEGIYWKYESALKKWDSELYSVVGAAGELFAIRRELYEEVEKDTILDDFMMSLRIAQRGFKIKYEPDAYAVETASASIKDEMKRKVRICAGGIQSIIRLKSLLNPFKYGVLTFQYISHRVLRWTLTPLLLFALIPLNILLATSYNGFYAFVLYAQILFYFLAITGWYFANKEVKVKALFVPYYFLMMNVSAYLGFMRQMRGNQSVIWERAKRAS